MRRLTGIGLVAAAALSTVACATITKGSKQVVTINSNVDGADVLLDGQKIGTTPFAGQIAKGKEALTISKPGYRTASVTLSRTLEPMFWGNIIIGGTLGSITDFASASAFQYAPATYQVELQQETQTSLEFQRQVAARKFALVYLNEISIDLGRGGGDHLSALLGILNGDGPVRVDAAAVREALRASGGDPVRFGHRIVAMI